MATVRVALVDLRGHGESDTTFAGYGDQPTATDLIALVEHLGGPAVIVGNSMAAGSAVLVAAEDVAVEVGLGSLTLAAVALRLGVRLPSLYKHVAGMDGLQREVTVRARHELAGVLDGAVAGLTADAAVTALATEFRRWAGQHPGRYAATVRAPDPDPDVERASAARPPIRGPRLHNPRAGRRFRPARRQGA